MDWQTQKELRMAIQPYLAELPVIRDSRQEGAPEVDYILLNTDKLLAWLPIEENAWWEFAAHFDLAIGGYEATLYCRTCGRKYLLAKCRGITFPEAILRCWLAWKTGEKE